MSFNHYIIVQHFQPCGKQPKIKIIIKKIDPEEGGKQEVTTFLACVFMYTEMDAVDEKLVLVLSDDVTSCPLSQATPTYV